MQTPKPKKAMAECQPSSFLCSPIPKDSSQALHLGDSSSPQIRAGSYEDVITPEQSRNRREFVKELQGREHEMESKGREALHMENDDCSKNNKRKRYETESAAVFNNEELKREIQMLKVQQEARSQLHHIELKERDMQLDRLRRQLKLAVAEGNETLSELKAITNTHSVEKLVLEKKVVEMGSQLELVEDKLNEWKEKALEASSQLRSQTVRSTMKIQLLEDELETAHESSLTCSQSENNIFESKIRLLESLLKEKSMEADDAASSLFEARETLNHATEVRELNEQIKQLQSTERNLKAELVDLIEASRSSCILQEKWYQTVQKLKQSEERNAELLKQNESALLVVEANKKFHEYFKPIVNEAKGGISLEDLKTRPAAAVVELYKARQNAYEILFEQKNNVELQRLRLEKQCKKLQSDLITADNNCAKNEMHLTAIQEKMNCSNNAATHLRKLNKELREILETYGNHLDEEEENVLQKKRFALLNFSLKQSQELIEEMESAQNLMATPAAVQNYMARIERLEKLLSELKQENESLRKHLEMAELNLAVFEKRLGRGEFNIETTKIMHLAVNPTRELLESKTKTSDAEQLRQENEMLRARLCKLTEGDDSAATIADDDKLTTMTSYETVEGLKKLNQRLKQVFGDQIRQYREAVYLLTGYKVDLRKSNGIEMLRLRSVYAEHDDDELLVRMEADGSLELLESDFCSQINQRVFAYLTACRSFPAFLSTLTLHLFEKQTFQGN